MVVLSPVLVLGCDCKKTHDAGNDFAAKSTPRQGCQMQSLKGHKTTLIAVVDLLRWAMVRGGRTLLAGYVHSGKCTT